MTMFSLKAMIQNASGGIILPVRTLAITALCIVLFFVGGAAQDLLIYDRALVNSGEWWRLITGQLVHVGYDHVFWDVSAFLMLSAMIEAKGRQYFWAFTAFAFIPIGVFVYMALPDLQYYAGLSGGLNAFLFVTTYEAWRRDGGWFSPVILIGSALKIVIELWIHGTLFTNPALPPVPEVHALGYLCGVLWIYGQHLLNVYKKYGLSLVGGVNVRAIS